LGKQFDLPFARLPELIGGEPQPYGGYGQNYRERTDYTLVVMLKKEVDLLENECPSRVEGGAVFFIIVIGGLLTVLWLYQAQR
jgi:hypothetical protein